MQVAELVVAIAMLVFAVQGMRVVYTGYGRADFSGRSAQRYVLGIIVLLTASSAIQLWRHPETMSHWFSLGFNTIAVLAALIAAIGRRRQASRSSGRRAA